MGHAKHSAMRRGWLLLLYGPYLDLVLQFGVVGVRSDGANRALESEPRISAFDIRTRTESNDKSINISSLLSHPSLSG